MIPNDRAVRRAERTMPSCSFDVFQALGRSQARLLRSAAPGQGTGLARWTNHDGEVRYQSPSHHTLSFYLKGRRHLRRCNPGAAGGADGTLSILPAGHRSEWAVSGELQFIHVYVAPALLAEFASASLGGAAAAADLRELSFVEDPYLERLLRSVLLALDWSESADRLALSYAIDLVLLHLLKRYLTPGAGAIAPRGGLAPAAQRRVAEYIESHLDQPLTIADLARVAGLSSHHFARMFKASWHIGPHSYVLRRRISRARELLGNPLLSLQDVAIECGFSSQGHFSNRFKEVVGVTPRQFRAGG